MPRPPPQNVNILRPPLSMNQPRRGANVFRPEVLLGGAFTNVARSPYVALPPAQQLQFEFPEEGEDEFAMPEWAQTAQWAQPLPVRTWAEQQVVERRRRRPRFFLARFMSTAAETAAIAALDSLMANIEARVEPSLLLMEGMLGDPGPYANLLESVRAELVGKLKPFQEALDAWKAHGGEVMDGIYGSLHRALRDEDCVEELVANHDDKEYLVRGAPDAFEARFAHRLALLDDWAETDQDLDVRCAAWNAQS
jgi:hypothetical protein